MSDFDEETKLTNNPFCENCKESDCCISTDGTCAMIRVYQKASKVHEIKSQLD